MSNNMIFPNPNKLTELLLYGNPLISDSDNKSQRVCFPAPQAPFYFSVFVLSDGV